MKERLKERIAPAGESELVFYSVGADGEKCTECRRDAPAGKLLVFVTRIGNKHRPHDGWFCSKVCHDRYHGLAPRE